MPIEILQAGPLLPSVEQALNSAYTVHRLWQAEDRKALLAEIAPRVRAIATSGNVGAKAELIDALPKLEIISCFGVGVDAIDTGYCEKKGVIVTNTPDVLTDEVADLAIGLTLATLRRIPQGDAFVRAGQWPGGKFPLTDKLGGKTMGILGFGRIGQAIGQRAEAFGVTVVHSGPRDKGTGHRYYADLAEMAAAVDILMIACPGGPETEKLVDARVIAALGPKGYVINIARGSVVDEPALVEALVQGKLKGAGLDVFVNEPQVPEALFTLENVVLQPHVGSATHQTRAAMGDLVVRNLAAHFSNQPLPSRYC